MVGGLNLAKMETNSSYKDIFKTTFLFSFVQVFNIIVKVVTNKVVAILLGAEGMGIISLFNSAIGTVKAGCGLGIGRSAIRDISEAYRSNDAYKFLRLLFAAEAFI